MQKTTKLVGFIVAVWVAALAWNHFLRSTQAFAYTAAVFVIGVATFVGTLNISRELRGSPSTTFDDGDVRLAVASTFVTVFLALVSFYAFTLDEPTPFARILIERFLDLTALVVGFYFATSGAIEFLQLRERSRSSGTGDASAPAEGGQAPDHG